MGRDVLFFYICTKKYVMENLSNLTSINKMEIIENILESLKEYMNNDIFEGRVFYPGNICYSTHLPSKWQDSPLRGNQINVATLLEKFESQGYWTKDGLRYKIMKQGVNRLNSHISPISKVIKIRRKK